MQPKYSKYRSEYCGGILTGIIMGFVIFRIMGFVIPVVFYEITNVECVYWCNTTVFIGRI